MLSIASHPEIGEYIAAILQTSSILFAIYVLHRTLFKNEDREE